MSNDICDAIKEFFDKLRSSKQINANQISLVPKVKCPMKAGEFRPIACCNVIYKTISKMMCNRLRLVLPNLISQIQSAFLVGRSIIENILVCQDLIKHYNRKKTSPKCLMKIDLRKAYDSVKWDFIDDLLKGFCFPEKFRYWIKKCIRTTTFSISCTGSLYWHFKGTRGIRQGDPISPLIFVMVMEYLSRTLKLLEIFLTLNIITNAKKWSWII